MPGGGDSLTIVFVLLALASWLLPALLKAGKNQAGNNRRTDPGQPHRDYLRPEPGTLEPENPQFSESFRGSRGWSREDDAAGAETTNLSLLFRELLGVDEAGVSKPPPKAEIRRAVTSPPKAAAAPPAETAKPAEPEEPPPGDRLIFSDHPVVQGIIFSELLAPPLCERPYDR